MNPTPMRPKPRHARRQSLVLRDGRRLWLRPIDVRDAEPIAGAFSLLGEDEVRKRYLHVVKELSRDYLQTLVEPPPGRACAYVAAEQLPPGEALVGAVARLTRTGDGDEAEFALLVSHFVAGRGLGYALMQRVFEWARAHGITRIRGDILADNSDMIRLAQALGFRREPSRDDPGMMHVVLDLAPRVRPVGVRDSFTR